MHVKSKLSISILIGLGLIVGSSVTFAQEAEQLTKSEEDIEVIEVRGMLKTIKEAISIKRESINSVDAIAAEDVGKMPDQNVAESLQRIPGVTIERNNGDGQLISVRGLGPDYNAVTLNGRTLATDNQGRAFSFDVLPSELITGAKVYKSPTAKLNGASIGATIDITTLRPLAQDEFVTAFSIKDFYNDLSESHSPSLSGLVSYRNEESTFGASLVVSYLERESRIDNFVIGAGHVPRSSTAGGFFEGRLAPDVEDFTDVDTPSNVNPLFQLTNDKRLGINAAVQYMPSDDITMTVDVLYSHLDQDEHESGLAYDFSGGTLLKQIVENNSAVYQKFENGFVDQTVWLRERPSETQMIGYNLEWVKDKFTYSFDVAYSKATVEGGPENNWFTTIRRTGMTLEYDRRTGSPIYDFSVSHPDYDNAATDVNNIGGHFVEIGGTEFEDETLEYKFDVEWDSYDDIVVNAGISKQQRKKTQTQFGVPFDVMCAFCGGEVYGPMPSDIFTATDLNWFPSYGGDVEREWVDYDVKEYIEALRAFDGPYADFLPNSTGYEDPTFQPEGSSKVKEDVWIGYLMFDYETELSGMPFAINTGVRIESTKFTSNGAAQTVLSAKPNGLGQTIIELSDVVPVGFEGDYLDILPSLNMRLSLSEDLLLRLTSSSVMTRPTLSDLSPAQHILSNPGNEAISRGNPDLDPFRASQIDLGLEWYFNQYGLLSGSIFYKNIDSFVSDQTTPEQIDEVVFQVTVPENGDGATVQGFELGYSQVFSNLPAPFDGLGVEASYTMVSSDADFSNAVTGVNYGLEGLSENSYSLVGFYEKGPVQARIAYTYRDNFLQTAFGRNGDPEFFDEYDQLDGSISYAINDHFTLQFEALNLTDSEEFIYSTTPDRTKEFRKTGRRFVVGVRARF
jgi:TonB-dependent receptor